MTTSAAGRPRGIIPPETLLAGYAAGAFPMADARDGGIGWYTADPRGIIPLDGLKVSRSLRQTLRKGIFEIRWNTRFEEVMRRCAGREETWISEEIVASYAGLHRLGYAHSVESWHGGGLAGGLYGVALGGAFFGESMFSTVRDASKAALAALVGRLRERGFELLDTQFLTPHLARLGAVEIPLAEYLRRLKPALTRSCTLP